MADRSDKDELDRAPAHAVAPAAGSAEVTGLPMQEPAGLSADQQHADLLRMIEELEGQLEYMGSAHPQRTSMQLRLQQLQAMVSQMDKAKP